MKAVLVIALLGLFAVNYVSALKCYQCENCSELEDKEEKECTTDTFEHQPPATTVNPTANPTNPPVNPTNPPVNPTTPPVNPTTPPVDPTTPPVNPTTPPTTSADTEVKNNPADKLHSRFIRQVKADEKKYKCFLQEIKFGNNGTIVRRGCTDTKTECGDKTDLMPKCELCEDDGCNFGTNIKSWAISSLVLIAVIKMFF